MATPGYSSDLVNNASKTGHNSDTIKALGYISNRSSTMSMTLKAAKEIAGSLGYPSKMPGTSYGISAFKCKTGAKLAKVPGSVCYGCYAMKGNYLYDSVAIAHKRRLASIDRPQWATALAMQINAEYNKACREYMDLIQTHARQAKRIERRLSRLIGSRNLTRGAGYGLALCIKTAMATIQRPAVLNPAMYPLMLPVSGATVALSPSAMNCTTLAETDYALIQTICRRLAKQTIGDFMPTSGVTPLPDGLQLTYYFRHHDSGDLQSTAHLAQICQVATLTPDVKHWLPTREFGMVTKYIADGGVVPRNLVIRISATMVDGPATKAWPITSTVHTVAPPAGARLCPAPTQNNECGNCRACWNPNVLQVSYHKH